MLARAVHWSGLAAVGGGGGGEGGFLPRSWRGTPLHISSHATAQHDLLLTHFKRRDRPITFKSVLALLRNIHKDTVPYLHLVARISLIKLMYIWLCK